LPAHRIARECRGRRRCAERAGQGPFARGSRPASTRHPTFPPASRPDLISRPQEVLLTSIDITVNGVRHDAEVEPRTLLADFVRNDLGLTGTKIGCETSQCGACTVLLDGHAVKSCTVLAVQADGGSVTTIEGLAGTEGLHPLQEAFWENHGLQCGFCTP